MINKISEDALNPSTITLSSTALDSEDTSAVFLLAADCAKRLRVGSLFKSTISGKSEVIQAHSVTSATVGVTRGFGATDPQDHAASVVFTIIGSPAQEGADMPSDQSTIRSKVSNYTQIFTKGVEITGTKQAVDEAGLANELAYQTEARMMELKRDLDKAIIGSYKAGTVAGSDTVYRTMSGLREYIGAASGNSSATAEALTESVVNAMVKAVWDDGGTPDTILVGGIQKRKISTFDEAYRKTEMSATKVGYTVTSFLSDLGIPLNVIVDRWVTDDTAFLLSSDKVKYLPLQGRSFFMQDVAKTGDSFKKEIVGEYTCEVRNALEAHYVHTNLTVI